MVAFPSTWYEALLANIMFRSTTFLWIVNGSNKSLQSKTCVCSWGSILVWEAQRASWILTYPPVVNYVDVKIIEQWLGYLMRGCSECLTFSHKIQGKQFNMSREG